MKTSPSLLSMPPAHCHDSLAKSSEHALLYILAHVSPNILRTTTVSLTCAHTSKYEVFKFISRMSVLCVSTHEHMPQGNHAEEEGQLARIGSLCHVCPRN